MAPCSVFKTLSVPATSKPEGLDKDQSGCPFRQPKVHDFDDALPIHHDVAGFQVAVNHTRPMRRCQSAGDLNGIFQGIVERESPAGENLCQGLTGYILHDDKVDAFVADDVIDSDDVRMVQGGSRFGFLHKPAFAFGIVD